MTKRVRTTRRLEVWLKDTSVPLFVLNVQRRLVFFNVGCEKLTGWTAADVLGQVSHYVTESDPHQPDAVMASLAPPAEIWSGHSATTPVLLAHRERDPISCVIHFYPLTDADNKVQAALGIIRESQPANEQPSISKSQRLHVELAALRHSLRQQFAEGSLIGRSPAIRRVLGQLKLAQQSTLPILLTGEAGTGRQHLARQIHYSSDRGQSIFVPLDCRRLPAEHLAQTLQRLMGIKGDEVLQPGTVYLDQIEALPRELQKMIVELIESKHPHKPRIMAASQRPLEPFVESDELTSDLFFALTPLTIVVPPLRNRPEDLEPLAQFFLEELNRGDSRQVNGFHDNVWHQFRRYHWPGNVNELRRVVTEARQQCPGTIIETDHLPFGFRTGVDGQSIGPATPKRTVPLDPLLLQVEREQIELALAEARHNKAKAAELLGITRPRLYRRMEILGIVDEE
jgi:transcriptional regulator with PAS, ATPase and Fis domain